MPGITKIPLSLILLHHHRAEKIKRNRIEITMDSVGCRVEKMVSGSCGVLSGGGSRCGCAFVANHCGASLNLSGFAWMLLLHFFACECVSFSNSFFFSELSFFVVLWRKSREVTCKKCFFYDNICL